MKKNILSILMAGVLVLSLAACGAKDNTQPAAESKAVSDTGKKSESSGGSKLAADPDSYTTIYGTVLLGQYKGMQIEVPEQEAVTEDDIDLFIAGEYDDDPALEETDEAAQLGDTVNIDYQGLLDGVAFAGGTAQGYDLTLGSGQFIDGFEDGLVGVRKGEDRDLNLRFPDQYHSADLAGKDTVFKVHVNQVKRPSQGVADDAWVEYHTGGAQKTMAEYRETAEGILMQTAELAQRMTGQMEAIAAVSELAQFEINEDEAEEYCASVRANYEAAASQAGMSLDEYLEFQQVEGGSEGMDVRSREALKEQLIIGAVFTTEKMNVEDEDRAFLTKVYGYDYATLAGAYGPEYAESLAQRFKVLNFLYDNAVTE